MHSIKLHYGGTFGEETPTIYVGGRSKEFDNIDPDKVTFTDVKNWIEQLDLLEKVIVLYVAPSCDELRMICSYMDLLLMFKEFNGIDVINIYTEKDAEVYSNDNIDGYDRSTDDEYEQDDDVSLSDSSSKLSGNPFEDESDLEENVVGQSQIGENVVGLIDEPIHPTDSTDSESDLNDSPLNSDEERNDVYPLYDENEHMKNPKLRLGMIFKDAATYRLALKEHSIRKGYNFEYLKNEGDRVTVKCVDKCPFRVHASQMQGSKTFQIKSLTEHCIHPRRYQLRSVTSTWLANKYLNKLIDNPKWTAKAIRRTVRREHHVFVSKNQVYRAKAKALEAIDGNHKRDFTRVRDYCGMIRRTNPGSIACVTVERPWPDCAPLFKRMFVQYSAQIKGFMAGCRPVIGLDACHLKGPYGGQLMHAVATDGNNGTFPLAMAVVEAENKDSWTWFLNLLCDAIGSPQEKGWIFISDRQKGLTQTFKTIMPDVEHRFCMRHLYANFRGVYKGEDLKHLVWAAASAYTMDEFKTHMEELKALNINAYQWLIREHPKTWARSHFPTNSKCDMICNNISESFNDYIMDGRDKPIITMMEFIRKRLMTRFQEKKDALEKMNGDVCSNIMELVEKAKFDSTVCEVLLAGNWIFEVSLDLRTFIVDLNRRQCSCNEFDLTGIPCVHACAAIMYDKRRVEDFVHKYYWKDTFKKIYEDMIYPIPDEQEWVEAEGDKPQPPRVRIAPGRPKKSRIRAPDEPRASGTLSRVGRRMTCSNCNELGHNKMSCKNPPKPKRKKISNSAVGSSSGVNVLNATANTSTRGGGRFGAMNGGRFGARGGRRPHITGYGNPIGPNGETFTGQPISRRATTTKKRKTIIESSSGVAQNSSGVAQNSSGVAQNSSGQNNVNLEQRVHPKVIRKSTRFGDILFTQGSVSKST